MTICDVSWWPLVFPSCPLSFLFPSILLEEEKTLSPTCCGLFPCHTYVPHHHPALTSSFCSGL